MELATQHVEDEVGDRHWWFQGRRAILATLLRGEALPSDAVIYDVGCGTGQNFAMLGEFGRVTGVDRSADVLALARARGCSTLQGDLNALPLPDASADLMVATDVLEHLEDDHGGARELIRVLRPGGLALVTVPAFMWLWGKQDDVSHHLRRYTRAELRTVLETAGFTLHRLTYFNLFLLPPTYLGRQLVRLLDSEVVSENTLTPPWLDRPLSAIFNAERWFLPHLDFPLGVSLVALARKPE